MPCFVVDEHSSINCRRVFDQDNKGWKAIPNALKGRVIPNDDQYSLGWRCFPPTVRTMSATSR
jgi:hypothetical protein